MSKSSTPFLPMLVFLFYKVVKENSYPGFWFCFHFVFWIRSHCVALAGLELTEMHLQACPTIAFSPFLSTTPTILPPLKSTLFLLYSIHLVTPNGEKLKGNRKSKTTTPKVAPFS